ncbi:MAG: hypothetical protein CMD72_03520 [Gammaproteobacteria bacterium]|nr:hypothetical protein [Gammaproteobacteria bacterium]
MQNQKNPKRILMILGSLPPMKCGVGDSMVILAQEISSLGKKVGILTSKEAGLLNDADVLNILPNWHLKNFFLAMKEIKKWEPDLIHFQFPSLGYKTGFLPYFLCMYLSMRGHKIVQTWHEPPIKSPFSRNLTEKLKRFIVSFRYLPNVIFSSNIIEVEKNALKNLRFIYKPFMKNKKVSHIPVTSNIPASSASDQKLCETRKMFSDDKKIITYFGFVFPHKGIDQIFKIADPKRDHVVLICSFKEQDSYHIELKNKINSFEEWKGSFTITGFIDSKKVADILMASDIVLLPFRTESTLRNGSIFAAMLQGTTIVTTSKNRRGYDQENNIYFNEPDDIHGMSKDLDDIFSKPTNKKKANLLTWRDIAKKHIKLYENF